MSADPWRVQLVDSKTRSSCLPKLALREVALCVSLRVHPASKLVHDATELARSLAKPNVDLFFNKLIDADGLSSCSLIVDAS